MGKASGRLPRAQEREIELSLTGRTTHAGSGNLIVVGREDALTPPPLSEAMAAKVPGAKLVVIDGAGHLPNLEQPAAFNAALRAFLAAL